MHNKAPAKFSKKSWKVCQHFQQSVNKYQFWHNDVSVLYCRNIYWSKHVNQLALSRSKARVELTLTTQSKLLTALSAKNSYS